MKTLNKYIGLDVHKDTTVIAVAEEGRAGEVRLYGTPNRWQEIFQANRDVLQGSSALRIGMQLRIP